MTEIGVTRTVASKELHAPLIPYESARALARQAVTRLPEERTRVVSADGLVLADEIVATGDVPHFDNSAMDGFAIVAARTTTATESDPVIVDTSHRIATGHPLPDGCDAVVPWEWTEMVDDATVVLRPVTSGQNVRRGGAEVRAGDLVLAPGTRIGPLHVGLLSTLGYAEVTTYRRPRVAVASSGDEVAAPGTVLEGAQVYDSNRFFVGSAVQRVGGEVVDSVLLQDDPVGIESWLTSTVANADVVVTSGGASVGERDWTRQVVGAHGEWIFWHVGMKPGKPIGLARIGETLVFVLPGNPGATFACTHAFVVPVLDAMMGRPFDDRVARRPLLATTTGSPDRTMLAPVRDRSNGVEVLAVRSSQLLTPYLDATGLAVIAPGGEAAGAEVDVFSLSW